MKLSNVQDSIIILVGLQQVIEKYMQALVRLKDTEDFIAKSAYTNMILIHTCSYLDEWELLGSNLKDDKEMMKVRNYSKPALKEIRKWKDLTYYRNCYLAHNLRDNKKSNLLLQQNLDLKIPISIPDMTLLAGLLFCINEILSRQFTEDYKIAIKTAQSQKVKVREHGIKTFEEAKERLMLIGKQITELMKIDNA